MASEVWTPTKLLNWMSGYFTEKGIDAPRLSAELILSNILGLSRIELYVNFEKEVSAENLTKLRALVKRASEHEPIAYLVGKTEFYSMEIEVTKDTLIPRPETEMLVERAVDFLRARESVEYVLDLCTGSGCIAAAIAKGYSEAKIIATDICESALEVAERNIENHGLTENVHLLAGDLFEPICEKLDNTQFDLIVSNPPYVTTGEYEELDRNVKDYEPKKALVAGVDGLDVYKRIIERVDEFLKPDGALIMEIGYRQGPAIRELLEEKGVFSEIKIEKDFCDNDRIVSAFR